MAIVASRETKNVRSASKVARKLHSGSGAAALGLALAASSLNNSAEAAVAQKLLSDIEGVFSVSPNNDGSISVTLVNGEVVILGPDEAIINEDGTVTVTAAGEKLLAFFLIEGGSTIALLATAGVVGAAALVVFDSGGSGPPANQLPQITSEASVSIAENLTDTGYTATARDANSDPITYSISGEDAALFQINAMTGDLSFITAPDFEAPADGDGDNIFNLTLTASDGRGGVATQNLVINLTNANDITPVITSAATITTPENEPVSITIVAEDADGDTLSYSITGGADATLFSIDVATGELVLINTPNFENPEDADGDNVYNVQVSVSDGANTSAQDISVTVTDMNEASIKIENFTTASFEGYNIATQDIHLVTEMPSAAGGIDGFTGLVEDTLI